MYRVQLQNFEGPLDLLLYFIRRDELDIYDIPISYITQQFLEYIRFLEELDLTVASEFIYMASVLMAIKAKMMIPREESDEESEEDDPRFELVQALLEYKRYKEMAEKLQIMDQKQQHYYTRGFPESDELEYEPNTQEHLREVSLFDLMEAFKSVLLVKKTTSYKHTVTPFETSIEEQTDFVLDYLQTYGKSSFLSLCANMQNRIAVVVTFLAILELIKEQRIVLFLTDTPTTFYLQNVESVAQSTLEST